MNNFLFKTIWRGMALAIALLGGVQLMGQTFSSGAVNLQIGPNPGQNAVSTLNVSGLAGDIGSAGGVLIEEVCIDLQHTWAIDCDIFLISPAGTEIELSTDNGGIFGLNARSELCLSDNGTALVTTWTGGSPTGRSWIPEEAIAPIVGCGGAAMGLSGEDPNGQWTLEVRDDAFGDVGTLFEWSIRFSTVPAASCMINVQDIILPADPNQCDGQFVNIPPPSLTGDCEAAPLVRSFFTRAGLY